MTNTAGSDDPFVRQVTWLVDEVGGRAELSRASGDPRTLVDNSLPVPPDTTVQVRCRYYAPSIPSVVPDGFWYLIDAGDWAGRWSPANSSMNGDVPGGRTLHNTDVAVPVCG